MKQHERDRGALRERRRRSDTEGVEGQDSAVGASIRYPNDIWSWELSFLEIQPGFEPALGFVPRRDIRRYDGEIGLWDDEVVLHDVALVDRAGRAWLRTAQSDFV